MDEKRSWLALVLLVAVVAAVFLMPGLSSAQECDPYHPECCEFHPELCEGAATTKAGKTFFVSETTPDDGPGILPIVAISLGVLGVALVARRLLTTASKGE